jgi:hypothetical protein
MSNAPLPVSDLLSNFNDQRATAARIIGRSRHRQAIFETVYRGQKQTKTIEEIAKHVGISTVHVLKEGGKMANLLFEKVRGGYKKKQEFATRYKDILTLAKNPKKLQKLHTKISPKISTGGYTVKVVFPSAARQARQITIDDIDSFARVGTKTQKGIKSYREERIKKGFARIIGESGRFKDWGGEKSDLYTTRLRLKGRRAATAIAFKGKATKGKLVPAKMGTNGDQVNRLFAEPAEVFLVVFGGQIDSAVLSQMQAFAVGVALSGGRVYYGVVDGTDLGRLIAAYPNAF